MEELKQGWEFSHWMYANSDTGQLSKIVAHIRNNDTGQVRDYPTEGWWSEDYTEHPNPFIWEDGNFSCDCNRAIFFYEVKDEEYDYNTGCSDSLFSVNLSNPVDGLVYYREFD